MTPFNYANAEIVFQEVPDHISLLFTITGCQVGCKGCHSAETWKASRGTPLSHEKLVELLDKYQGLISCVVFLGGEWQPTVLLQHLQTIRARGLKTCLYTGLETVPEQLSKQLDYLKTGRWDPKRGGLWSNNTNQQFTDLNSGQSLLHKFQERHYESTR